MALRYRDLKPRLSFGTLLLRALIESIANCRDEFFVVERLHEKGDRADGHCGRPGGKILSRGNDNYTSLGGNGAKTGQHFQASHLIHQMSVTTTGTEWGRVG